MKRRGFTLIELMVVIAIIIILAAIAIPNYLTMTTRAKKSRVASDFAAVATALETYRTDWGKYPIGSSSEAVLTSSTTIYKELTGTGSPVTNTGTTAAGDTAPITYMAGNILTSMINPYSNKSGDEYHFTSSATTGKHWLLTARTVTGEDTTLLSRNDETTTLSGPSATVGLPTD
jgi:prepilin-type N-terminal cleavage/methylation domain-containing protein